MYDIIFIGSGHAAWHGAQTLARAGKKVALVEANKVAGTCTNFGCNAKILLDGPAEMMHHLHHYHGIGINDTPDIIWPELMAYKHQVIDPLSDGLAKMLSVDGIDIIAGHAQFIDPQTITVGDVQYQADQFVIATGQRPAKLPITGAKLTHDSTDFLDLPEMPKSMIFIGAGYIAMEFASIAHAAGSQVTLIEYGDRALNGFDVDYAQQVVTDMSAKGIQFNFGQAVASVTTLDNGQYAVETAQGQHFEAEYVMDTTGRVANIDGLGLDTIGVAYDRQGVLVNDHLQTTVDNIYAAGDVIDKTQPKLTPTAIFESKYLMHLFAGDTTAPIDYPVIPSVVFTSPRIAKVGLQADQITTLDKYQIETHDVLKNWYRNVMNEQFGENELIFDDQHHLVGATEMSDYAEQVIGTLLPAVELGLDAEQVERMIHIFPSLESITWEQI